MFCSVKTIGNGDTQQVFVISRVPNVSSAMVLIKQFTISIMHGAVKLMRKLIPSD